MSDSDDWLEGELDLLRFLIKHPAATFYVRVTGHSMVCAGIYPGDILIVDRAVKAVSGDVIIERIYCADSLRGVQTTIQGKSIKHHYPIGRHLWVRETWTDVTPAFQGHKNEQPSVIAYRADDTVWNVETDQPIYLEPRTNDAGEIVVDRWRPSIFMPRFASRISLEIKRIRVERLQDISEDDAEAEGVSPETDESEDDVLAARFLNGHDNGHYPDGDCVTHYRHLWEKINGKGSWDTNPFVLAVDFMRIR